MTRCLRVQDGKVTQLDERALPPSAYDLRVGDGLLLFSGSGGLGAIRVDGKLVDKPVLLLAQGVLAALE